MPASSISNATPLAAVQIPADEVVRHALSTTGGEREALVQLVDALREAVLNRTALQKLGAFVLGKEHTPREKTPATLLQAPAETGSDISCESHDDFPRTNAGKSGPSEESKLKKEDTQPSRRAFFYIGDCPPADHKKRERLAKPRRYMAPSPLVKTSRADARLDTRTAAKASDGNRDAQAHLAQRPARALSDTPASLDTPVEHRVLMGRLMAQGFDESWAKNVLKAHADDLSRVHAWFAHASDALDTNLDSHLDDAMKTAIANWLGDEAIGLEALRLLPAMIQSDMRVEQIDKMLRAETPPPYGQIEKAFGFAADTPEEVRYGVVIPDQLLDRVLHGNVFGNAFGTAEEGQLRDASELSKKSAGTRDDFRRLLRAVQGVHSRMTADTPQARQCECLADTLEKAIAGLDDVLQPRTEARWEQEYRQINDKLATLAADLNFQIKNLAEPAGIGAARLRQFV